MSGKEEDSLDINAPRKRDFMRCHLADPKGMHPRILTTGNLTRISPDWEGSRKTLQRREGINTFPAQEVSGRSFSTRKPHLGERQNTCADCGARLYAELRLTRICPGKKIFECPECKKVSIFEELALTPHWGMHGKGNP